VSLDEHVVKFNKFILHDLTV